MDDPKTWVAIYAAIVATSALLLNLRTWIESGPQIKINIIPDGMIIGGGEEFDERDLVIIKVTNRGKIPVMITNLLLFEMPTLWSRWRRQPTRNMVVANPQLMGYPRNIPGELTPAHVWTGVVRNVFPELHNGNFYVGVSTSHHDRPFLVRIPALKKTAGSKP
jgi:hypothetical protein